MEDDEFYQLVRKRNLAAIPKDQQQILETTESWFTGDGGESSERKAPARLRVPVHIVNAARQSWEKSQRTAEIETKPKLDEIPDNASVVDADQEEGQEEEDQEEEDHGYLSQPEEAEEVEAAPTTPPPARSSPIPTTRDPPSSLSHASPGISQASWSQSPHLKPIESSAIVKETPYVSNREADSPIRAEMKQKHTIDYHFASSYEQEDLDMDIPQAHHISINVMTAPAVPISRIVHDEESETTSTPPCAQPDEAIIPATVLPQHPSPHKSPRPASTKPYRRRMRPVAWSDDSNSPLKAQGGAPFSNRMRVTKQLPQVQSSILVTSSIVPATYDESLESANNTTVEHMADAEEADEVLTESEDDDVAESEMDDDPTVINHAITRVDSPRASNTMQRRSSDAVSSTQSPNGELSPVDLGEHNDPFGAFCYIYPDYSSEHQGTLETFIKACIYLEYLTQDLLLRECLFDDFIKAFSGGYYNYFKNAGPNQEPLPAFEWFNNLSGDITYTSMAVTRKTLGYILSTYPEQVTKTRNSIQGQKQGEHPKKGKKKKKTQQEESSEPEAATTDTEATTNLKVVTNPEATTDLGARTPAKTTTPEPHVSPTPEPLSVQHSPNSSPNLNPKPAIPAKKLSTAVRATTPPTSSSYMQQLSSSTPQKSILPQKRTLDDNTLRQQRLREHFRNRQASNNRKNVISKKT